jgi:hypothetical protein
MLTCCSLLHDGQAEAELNTNRRGLIIKRLMFPVLEVFHCTDDYAVQYHGSNLLKLCQDQQNPIPKIGTHNIQFYTIDLNMILK